MLIEQTMEKLSAMKLSGMLTALKDWLERGAKARDLDPADLVGLLVDTEWIAREGRKLTRRLQEAHFPVRATVEEIDYQHPRGLLKQKMLELISCRWIAERQNLILTGPTGIGKTFLPCALGNKACRDGYRVYYTRAPRLFGDLYRARADGTFPRFLGRLAKVQVLIIDDLGCAPLEASERLDLREVLEDRYSVSSTIITSQLKPKHWHSFIGDETVADAICDRLVHNAHRLELSGESMRKKRGMNTAGDDPKGDDK
jgi:DNA replication protein DnaC